MNLLDTDVIIDLIREKKHEVGAISVITLIEVLRGIDAQKRAKVKKLLEESFNLLDLDNEVVETYCSLYQNLRKEGTLIPDADLLIAATAMSHDMTLKTKDEHIKKMGKIGLKLAET
jgi:tRNA(fMet)-specific endonuclease VapC